MRLTTKGRFAVTAMIDLAMRQDQGPVTLAGISQRQSISLSYLEQLFGKLRRFNLVDSTRGPGGGYTLSRAGDEITVADIIVAVDEPLDATQCGGKGNCHSQESNHGQCMTHDLWSNLNKKMVEYLESVSLSDLVMSQDNRGHAVIDAVIPHAKSVNHEQAKSGSQIQAVKITGVSKTAAKPQEPKRYPVNSVFNLAQQN
jgi:Rrf2 family iron-sulfur cluster assembly transcriptional regulator